jgi:ElaB/YqjD/DUF883 family membrane-anchored ribosome-binding protein
VFTILCASFLTLYRSACINTYFIHIYQCITIFSHNGTAIALVIGKDAFSKIKENTMATQTAKNTSAKANTSNEQGHPVTDQLKESLHQSVDKLADNASVAEENIRRTATSSAENMSERKRLAEQKWQASSVRNYAVENPVATAGLAFAAGMLVTSLFRKK